MGLNYAFELITPRSGVRRLLAVLAEHLCDEDGRRVSAALAHGSHGGTSASDDRLPAAPIARGVSEDQAWARFWTPDNSYCFRVFGKNP